MQWGHNIEFLHKIEKQTGETPPALKNRKLPNRWNKIYWQAYQDLSSSRTWSQSGPHEIPYTAKITWLDENEVFDKCDRDDILRVVKDLDTAYIGCIAKKLESR